MSETKKFSILNSRVPPVGNPPNPPSSSQSPPQERKFSYKGSPKSGRTSPAYAMVRCKDCGPVALTEDQYTKQLERANRPWLCPKCMEEAEFDDHHWEFVHGESDDTGTPPWEQDVPF